MSPLWSICGMTRYWATPGHPRIGRMERVPRTWALVRACDPLLGKVRPGGAKTRRETGTNGGQKSPDELTGRWGNMSRTRVAMLAAAALMLVPASGAQAKPSTAWPRPRFVQAAHQAVTVQGIVEHQKALQNIADVNGGTRHTETPGYTASVAYVRERMKRAGWEVSISQFNMPEWQETAPPEFQQLTPDGQDLHAGHRRGRRQPGGRLHHVRVLADGRGRRTRPSSRRTTS